MVGRKFSITARSRAQLPGTANRCSRFCGTVQRRDLHLSSEQPKPSDVVAVCHRCILQVLEHLSRRAETLAQKELQIGKAALQESDSWKCLELLPILRYRDGLHLCRCAAVEQLSPGGGVERKSTGCAASQRVGHTQDLGVAETPKDCAPVQRDLDRLEA